MLYLARHEKPPAGLSTWCIRGGSRAAPDVAPLARNDRDSAVRLRGPVMTGSDNLCKPGVDHGVNESGLSIASEQWVTCWLPETANGDPAGKQRLAMAIDIARYDPAWPEQFRAQASKLTELLKPWLITRLEHIGSTSVPGLAVKPILDMMAGIRDLDSATEAIPVLISHGYTHGQHRPATLWLHKARSESEPEQALHLTEPGSSLWRERLAFRDALRADPLVARQYQELKERLAAESGDIATYTAGKREFVVQVLARAGIIAEDWRPTGRH